MPDISSHVGSKIFMKPKTANLIDVKIQIKSYCKIDEKPMSQLEYKKCVDDKVQKVFEQHNITCLPPWLSDKNKCNQNYSTNFYGDFYQAFERYVYYLILMSNIKIR